MLRAVVDDSGSGGDSTFYVLAGYLSTAEAWDRFTPEWDAELARIPRLLYFKASEAESLKGQFLGLSVGESNARVDRSIAIIQKHALHALSVRMRQSDYDGILRRAIPRDWDDPYFFLFTMMVLALPKSAQTIMEMRDKIDVAFDRQGRAEKGARDIYERVRAILPDCSALGNIDYRDDKDLVPLQAADLFAWHTRRFWCTPREPKRPQFDALRSMRFPPMQILAKRADLKEILDQWIRFQALTAFRRKIGFLLRSDRRRAVSSTTKSPAG
jgi:hypothetical protein